MSEGIIDEAERILTKPSKRVVFAPAEGRSEGAGEWLNVFFDGLRAGYVYFSPSDSGWSVVLNREWGAPRDVHGVVYLHRASAIERVENELAI